MVIDGRVQERTIIIKFEKLGYQYNLDSLIDSIIDDIKIILTQREQPKDLKIEIIIK